MKKNNDVKYKDLLNLFKDMRKEQIILFFVCTFSISADLCLVYQVQGLVDGIVSRVAFEELMKSIYLIIIFGISSFILTLIQTRKWHYFRYALVNSMRFKMYKSLMKKPNSFFDENTTGDLTSRVLNDGSMIAQSAGIDILMIVLNLFRVAAVVIILLYFNISLSLIVIGIIPVYFILLIKINGNMRKSSKEERESFADLQQFLIENINGIKEISMLNQLEYFTKKYDSALNHKYYSKVKKIINQEVLMYSLTNLMTIFLPVSILAFGAVLVYSNQMTIGTLIAFYTFLNKLVEPIQNLADSYQGSKKALGSADRVHDFIFNIEKNNRSTLLDTDLSSIKIDIDNFEFGENRVLENLKFKIDKGDKVFVMGESGKGKSTLLNLVSNFYDVKNGSIKLDNYDINDISKESLYNNVLMMKQDAFIFKGSIRENLLLGNNYSDEDIMKIAKIACASEIILEKGLDFELSESGSNISGGQKQRIALTRILLRKPNLLLLDEATSALDKKTEKQIVENLKKFVANHQITVIAVSHNEEIRSLCNRELVLV